MSTPSDVVEYTPPDDLLGQPAEENEEKTQSEKNKSLDRAGRQALKKLSTPVAGTLVFARCIAGISAVLAIAPYVALVSLGGLLFDAYQAGVAPDSQRVWFLVSVLVVTFCARVGLYALALGITHFADNRLRMHIQGLLLSRIGKAPLSWFTTTNSGRVRKAIQDDTHGIHMLIAHSPVEVTTAVVMPISLTIYAFIVDWRLGLLTLAVLPFFAAYYGYMMMSMGEKTVEMDARLARVSSTMTEFVSGISVVKAFGRVGRSHRQFSEAADGFTTFWSNWCEPLLKGSAISMSIISTPVVLLINLGGGALMVNAGWVTPVQVLTTSLIALLVPGSLITISSGLWAYQIAGASALRITNTLEIDVLPEPANPKKPESFDVKFNRVRFSYGDTLAADDVTLSLREGSVTALIGPSGSGKTTLATLLARFSDVDDGSITIGGVDVREMNTAELYKTVAFVLQDPQLFRMSIHDNITLGRSDASFEDVRRVAQAAQIADFVESLPKGYDTIVGQDLKLSGGESQRIAIARALLMDTPVLILDEATAMTDPDSEAEIQQALAELVRGRTVLVIAHRPASIIGADQIVVLNHGRVVAAGSHDDIIDEPHYRRVWEMSGQLPANEGGH